MTRLILFALLLLAIALPTQAITQPHLAPRPDWATQTPLPSQYTVPVQDISGGAYYLLVDTQVNVSPKGERQIYRDFAVHIENQSGVEEQSQITIEFDPSYESIVLHDISILRDGQLQDRHATAKVEILQRETELENLIRDGLSTLSIILKDVRVGDSVLYSYTLAGQNPIQQGFFNFSQGLNWSVPVEYVNFDVYWQKKEKLHHKFFNSDLTLDVKAVTKGQHFHVSAARVAAVIEEDNTPQWFSPRARLQLSEFASWQRVVDWGVPIYGAAVVSDPEIRKIANKLKLQYDNPKDRVAAALQITQNDIRYLGLELGESSHKPSPASVTLERRFGDCKDKTILFIALLKELNIEAFPALVNTEVGPMLPKFLPTINAFDHVITLVYLDGKSYWLDPTRSLQYGQLDTLYQPQYGHALVLKTGQQALTAITPGPEANKILTQDHFTLDGVDSLAAVYKTDVTYQGREAEYQHSRFASDGQASLAEQYLKYYEDYYYQVEVITALAFSDDRDTNQLTTHENYRLGSLWEDVGEGRREVDFYANSISSELAMPDSPRRTQPYYLNYPKDLRQIVTIKLPEDNWGFEKESFSEANAFFRFTMDVSFDAPQHTLTLDFSYQALAGYVEPEAFAEYSERVKAVQDYLSYGIYQNTTAPAADEPSIFDGLSVLHWVGIIFACYSILIIAWRVEVFFRKSTVETAFYPVSQPKFIAMWVLTFGVYGAYWFYKNFHYLKHKNNDSSMPVARGIFSIFWYFSLWKALSEDNKSRFEARHLPVEFVAAICAVLYFLSVFSEKIGYPILSVLVSCALVLPLVNYIQFVNQDNKSALVDNSRWNARHYLLGLISVPLLLFSFASELGLTPSERVVKGDALYAHTLTELRRRGVVDAKDRIQYFYSDASLRFRDDGNGFTNKHVFSYWMDEDNGFELERANFKDIANIELEAAQGWGENAVITITRDDESHFLVFASSVDGGDKQFFSELDSRWKTARLKLLKRPDERAVE